MARKFQLKFFHQTLELATHIQIKEKNKMDQNRKAACVPTCGEQDKSVLFSSAKSFSWPVLKHFTKFIKECSLPDSACPAYRGTGCSPQHSKQTKTPQEKIFMTFNQGAIFFQA